MLELIYTEARHQVAELNQALRVLAREAGLTIEREQLLGVAVAQRELMKRSARFIGERVGLEGLAIPHKRGGHLLKLHTRELSEGDQRLNALRALWAISEEGLALLVQLAPRA